MRRRISALLVGITVLGATLASGQPAMAAEGAKDTASKTYRYEIAIKTGNVSGAGTDARVQIMLRGTRGRQALELDDERDNFERNSYERYVRVLEFVGDIKEICLYRDSSGLFPDWYVDYAQAKIYTTSGYYRAVFNTWISDSGYQCRPAS